MENIYKYIESTGVKQENLFKESCSLRKKYFNRNVYKRGVIEISNNCQLNCLYCGMRKDNISLKRYRLNNTEILDAALEMQKMGINGIMLQSGDDYLFSVDEIASAIRCIKEYTELDISLCLGERNRKDIEKLFKAGASTYILKLETLNSNLYSKLRPLKELNDRIDLLIFMKEIGYEISSGFITGLPGQTIQDLSEGITLLKQIGVDGASISPFIPNDASPLLNENYGELNLSLNIIAIMRQYLGKVNIPSVSALSLIDPKGQELGFKAGANLITVNYSKPQNAKKYLIYGSNRNVLSFKAAKKIVQKSGLIF